MLQRDNCVRCTIMSYLGPVFCDPRVLNHPLTCDQIPPKYDKKSFSQRPLLGPECGKIQSQSTWLSVRAKDYVAKGFYWNASNIGSKQHKNHKHSQFCQVIYLK